MYNLNIDVLGAVYYSIIQIFVQNAHFTSIHFIVCKVSFEMQITFTHLLSQCKHAITRYSAHMIILVAISFWDIHERMWCWTSRPGEACKLMASQNGKQKL